MHGSGPLVSAARYVPFLSPSPFSPTLLSLFSLSLSLDLCRNFILGIEAFDASMQHERTCILTQEWSRQYVTHTSSLSLCCVCVYVCVTWCGGVKNTEGENEKLFFQCAAMGHSY